MVEPLHYTPSRRWMPSLKDIWHEARALTPSTSPFAKDDPDLPSGPYVRHPARAYMQNILPLFLISAFSFIFALYIHVEGEVPVPHSLSNFTTSNPRITAQIVTIFSSFLTAATRWGLSGSAALLARKRILSRPRPILEIEIFSSLKNISAVWDWRHQKKMMFLTWLLVALCALLTSGFVTLLNPLPISIVTEFSGGKELNLGSDSPRCVDWYSRTRDKLRKSCSSNLYYQDFGYSSCSADEVDILDVVKTSMRYGILGGGSDKYAQLVSIYPELNNTQMLGTTAGTLIPGPDGLQILGVPTLSPKLKNYNYTLELQGLWADVSCSYDKTSALNVEWGPVHNGSDVAYQISCPNSPPYETGNTTPFSGPYVFFGTAGVCPTENGENAILFRYFFNTSSSLGEGVDYLSCKFSARLGDVDSILDADLRAFTPLKQASSTTVKVGTTLSSMVVEEVMRMVLFHFNDPETREKLWSERFLLQDHRGKFYDSNLIEPAMQGMFEYEATRLRLMLTAMSKADTTFAIPEECLRDIKTVLLEQTTGWGIHKSTVLGLVPLLAVVFISVTMTILAMATVGPLPLFDPTNPASLIAATSSGNVTFPKSSCPIISVDNSWDEGILFTKVLYGKHEGGWGLKSV